MKSRNSSLYGRELRAATAITPLPLVDVADYLPGAVFDLRYFGNNNFIGEPVDGYRSARALLTAAAAQALQQVQQQLLKQQMALKFFDCYRPQRAAVHFARWAADIDDTRMKADYYPHIDKRDLFRLGYLVAQSSHSRGSTVDVTLVRLEPDGQHQELEMGTAFDYFDPRSNTDHPAITGEARANRRMLRQLMTDHGFVNMPTEWWHFTLAAEPYPDQYFDVVIE